MSNTIGPLINRLAFQPDESLASLLIRLSRRNYYSTPAAVINLCREKLAQKDIITRPVRPETYQLLAALTLSDVKDLYLATPHRFAKIVSPVHSKINTITLPSGEEVVVLKDSALQEHTWSDTNAPFCPHCLAESNYYRLNWRLQAVSACLKHRCLLVQNCPECQTKLGISDIVSGRCSKCAFKLTDSPAFNIADDEYGLLSQKMIQFWLGVAPTPVNGAVFPDHPPQILYQIAFGLHRAIRAIHSQWDYLHDPFNAEAAVSTFPCQDKSQITPMKSYLLYATALKGLLDWPNGFCQFLDAYRLRDQREVADIVRDDLGYLYSIRVNFYWKPSGFQFLRKALGRYLQENYQYGFALKQLRQLNLRRKIPLQLEFISEAEAAKILKLSPSIIKRLTQLGYIASYRQAKNDPAIRRFNLVRHKDVLELRKLWQEGIPLADASRMLGVSEEITLRLAKEGALTVRNFDADRRQFVAIDSQSIADFIKRLRQGPVRYLYAQQIETIGLAGAAQKLSAYGGDTLFIIMRLLAKEIRAFWPPERNDLEHLVVSVEDLERLKEEAYSQHRLLVDA